jgi:hypothetical protein
MKKYAVLIFILFEFALLSTPKLLGEDREHFVFGIHTGYSYAPKEKKPWDFGMAYMRYTTHSGYDFQLYFFKNIGIQFEFQRQLKQFEIVWPDETVTSGYKDDYYFLNLIYKINKFENKGFYPYLLIGRGAIDRGELMLDWATKLGGGAKYRPFKKSKLPIINLNFGIFYFIPRAYGDTSIYEQKQHLSLYFGMEIGI